MKRILIIEDDTDLAETTADFIKYDGYDVDIAYDGAEGIKKAVQHVPDLILCDIAMPGLSGYEVFNSLQQITYTSVIPFIFLTAKTELEDIRAGLQIGVDDYITKPFRYEDLSQTIKTRLEKQDKLLRINDEKFNTLLHQTNTGILVIKDDKIAFVNDKISELTGYAQDELIGINLINILYREDIDELTHLMNDCFEGIKKEFDTSARFVKKNREILELKLHASMVPLKNRKGLIISACSENEMESTDFSKKYNKKAQVLTNISKREKEVLSLLAKGYSTEDIADQLHISKRTVEGHRSNLISKTEAKNSIGLIVYAIKNAIIEV